LHWFLAKYYYGLSISNSIVTNNFLPENFQAWIKKELLEILTASGSPLTTKNLIRFVAFQLVLLAVIKAVFPFIDKTDLLTTVLELLQLPMGEDTVTDGGGGGRPATGIHAQLLAIHAISTQIQ
jgi:hypothetical protein